MLSLLLWNGALRSSLAFEPPVKTHSEALAALESRRESCHDPLSHQAGYSYKEALAAVRQTDNWCSRDVLELVKHAAQWCMHWPEDGLLWQDLWGVGKRFKDHIGDDNDSANERAILIIIYFTRAEPIATQYQIAAKRALQSPAQETQWNQSQTRSLSSFGSSDSCASVTLCANCGIEKRAMPVCARCKTQTYCSNRCLLAHRQAHQLECQAR